jgi:hypothetical protein
MALFSLLLYTEAGLEKNQYWLEEDTAVKRWSSHHSKNTF